MTVDIDKTAGGPAGTSPAGPEAIKAIPVRHYGRYVSAVVAIALLAAVVYAFSQGKINWGRSRTTSSTTGSSPVWARRC